MIVDTRNTGTIVREIVETYELPDELKEKIIGIATWQIEEKKLRVFGDIYAYVSSLVEKFQLPYNESFALRLDSRLMYDSNTTFHCVIGLDDPGLSSKFEYDRSKVRVTVSDLVDLLGGRLDSRSFGIIRQLLDNINRTTEFNISPEWLLLSIPQIQERLEVLVKKYEREGRIVIPKRPIIYAKLEPTFLIKFGARNYSGNPLAFFRDNLDTYGRMSRSELEKFDQGLYNALKRAKKLELAIPETKIKVRPDLTIQQIDEIVTAQSTYSGNARKTARNLSYDTCTILKYWKAHGLKANGKRETLPFTQERIDLVIAAHQKYGGNASEAERNEHYSKTTFLHYWRAAELEILSRGHPLNQQQIDEILYAYSVYGGNNRRTSRNLGYDQYTIRKILFVNIGIKEV